MKSAAVKRMRSALLETPRPACFVASQAAASRNPNTVFNIGSIGPHALQAGVTALHESGEEQQDLSWIPGAIRRRPAAALRRLERVVSGTARSEACAVLAGSRGQSSRRTPLASSSPCLASSLSQSFCERRSRKRASNMSDASFLPHGRSPSLRQHRRRREDSLCFGACGTPVSREVLRGSAAPEILQPRQPRRIVAFERATRALSLEFGFDAERRAALQAEVERLAEQQSLVLAALHSATRQRCTAVLSFAAAVTDRTACLTACEWALHSLESGTFDSFRNCQHASVLEAFLENEARVLGFEDLQSSASSREQSSDTLCVTRARGRLQSAFDERDDPLLSFLNGHAGSDCDPRAHLQDIVDGTVRSLQEDAPTAVRVLQNALNAIETLSQDLRVLAQRSEALECHLAVWTRDLVAMIGRVHTVGRDETNS